MDYEDAPFLLVKVHLFKLDLHNSFCVSKDEHGMALRHLGLLVVLILGLLYSKALYWQERIHQCHHKLSLLLFLILEPHHGDDDGGGYGLNVNYH
jgi:hypothetical protein